MLAADKYLKISSVPLFHQCRGHEACPVEEYMNGKGSLSVCDGPDDSNWDSSFFIHKRRSQRKKAMIKAKMETSQKIKALLICAYKNFLNIK